MDNNLEITESDDAAGNAMHSRDVKYFDDINKRLDKQEQRLGGICCKIYSVSRIWIHII